jgi:hypothetical protein
VRQHLTYRIVDELEPIYQAHTIEGLVNGEAKRSISPPPNFTFRQRNFTSRQKWRGVFLLKGSILPALRN